MASSSIKPALTVEQWAQRRTSTMWLGAAPTSDEPTLVITDGSGEHLVVSGADDLYALIILANDVLTDTDPRKITVELIDRLGRVIQADPMLRASCGDAVNGFMSFLSNFLPHRNG